MVDGIDMLILQVRKLFPLFSLGLLYLFGKLSALR